MTTTQTARRLKRISCDEWDKGYIADHQAREYLVTLNGIRLSHVITADASIGFVRCYKLNAEGNPFVDHNEESPGYGAPCIQMLFGMVSIFELHNNKDITAGSSLPDFEPADFKTTGPENAPPGSENTPPPVPQSVTE